MPDTIGMPIAGYRMKAYYSPIAATDAWTEMGHITDPSVAFGEREMIEFSCRGLEFKQAIPGQRSRPEATFKLIMNANTSLEAALLNSYESVEPIKVGFFDKNITTAGAKGLVFPGFVTKMDRTESDNEVVSWDITISYGMIFGEDGDILVPEYNTISA